MGFRMSDIWGRWNIGGEKFRMWGGGDVWMEWRRENFGCDIPDRMLAEENFSGARCPDRMLAEKNFQMQGRPDGMAAGGIPGAMCPDGMAAEEFRMRYVWVEWRREEFLDAICPGGMAAGGILDAICLDGMNVVMSSMKDRYGLYGYEGLGEWF